MADRALAMSLVHAYVCEHPEDYHTWVPSYSQQRGTRRVRMCAHYRSLPSCVSLRRLPCVCKFERLVKHRELLAPPVVYTPRCDRDGIIPRRLRVHVFA